MLRTSGLKLQHQFLKLISCLPYDVQMQLLCVLIGKKLSFETVNAFILYSANLTSQDMTPPKPL